MLNSTEHEISMLIKTKMPINEDLSLSDVVFIMLINVKMPTIVGILTFIRTGPLSAVGNVSGYRCVSDCRSRGCKFEPRPGPILSWRLIMKLFLRSFSSLQLNHSRRVVVSYKRKYVHEVLVNRLFKLAQEKVWLGELTVLQ